MNRTQVLAAIINKSQEDIQNWFTSLEDNDFIEATEILEQIARELPAYQTNIEFKKEVDGIAATKEHFEDICNKEAVQQLKYEIEMDETFKKLKTEFNGLREDLIEELLLNPDNEGLLNMIKQIIQVEKDHNTYNADEWQAISHLL